jgi:cold shock CspA family protein
MRVCEQQRFRGQLTSIHPRGIGWIETPALARSVLVPQRVLEAAGDIWPGQIVTFRLDSGPGRPTAFDVRRA